MESTLSTAISRQNDLTPAPKYYSDFQHLNNGGIHSRPKKKKKACHDS